MAIPATIEIDVNLPRFHASQAAIFRNAAKLNVVRCGRRWGKTKMMVALAANAAAKGKKVGLFTPEHKQLYEPYGDLLFLLRDIKTEANKTTGVIKTKEVSHPKGAPLSRGQIDFWSLNDNELAGRGREYDLVMIDEAAFTKNSQMANIWEKSINPTMATRPKATVWVFSTPNGMAADNFFYRICKGLTDFDFKEHYAPSSDNPLVSQEFLDDQKRSNRPEVFQQEFLAEFVNWEGISFFEEDKLLLEGKPVEFPESCESVFAVIDTAVKTGKEHDGTAVSFYANLHPWFGEYKLVILDWEITQIKGALLESWIPWVYKRLEELARSCKATYGSMGAYIEDAQSGSILLQQCDLRGLPVAALPSKLTSEGKDARAINASGPVYRGEVKFSRDAYEKVMPYKGKSENHLLTQIVEFRIGDKDGAKRSDDLLDTFTYAIAISLGDSEGIA